MCEDMADVDDLPCILDRGDQAILVTCDVEDRVLADNIGVRNVFPDISQVLPARPLRYAIPVHQWLKNIGVLAKKLSDCRFAGDPHMYRLPIW